jgi:hypothetical protein
MDVIEPRLTLYRRDADGAELTYDTFTGRLYLKFPGQRKTMIRRSCSSSEARHEAHTRDMRPV